MNESTDCRDEKQLGLRCREAIEAIDRVLATPPRDRHQIVDFGECAIVELRDCLIERYRQAGDPSEKQRLRSELDQVNLALSLITGIEYPGAGIQEKTILPAREVLGKLDLNE